MAEIKRMTSEELAQIKERADKAIASDWVLSDGSYVLDGSAWFGGNIVAECEEEDAAIFIANSGRYVAQLIAEIEALKKDVVVAKWKASEIAKSKNRTIRKLKEAK